MNVQLLIFESAEEDTYINEDGKEVCSLSCMAVIPFRDFVDNLAAAKGISKVDSYSKYAALGYGTEEREDQPVPAHALYNESGSMVALAVNYKIHNDFIENLLPKISK